MITKQDLDALLLISHKVDISFPIDVHPVHKANLVQIDKGIIETVLVEEIPYESDIWSNRKKLAAEELLDMLANGPYIHKEF